ncbi:helix-turn-helix domain-containing protein [Lentzea sp. NPDC005914]|uniref:TrmB family transcriptional regulator n=1 Tax=Lentzea sp. NPDC005914 TaxID=3154572 RepID=UPI0033CA3A4C
MSTPDLQSLGVSEPEQRVYEVLLGRSELTFAELAYLMPLGRSELRVVLRSLEEKGLLVKVTSRPVRRSAVPPALAVEVLARRHREQVEHARLVTMLLAPQIRPSATESSAPLASGWQTTERSFRRLEHSAAEELLILDRLPDLTDRGGSGPLESRASRVRRRTIYDSDGSSIARQVEKRRAATSGAEARVLTGVPMRLVIADRRVALVQHGPHDGHVVPQRSEALVTALAVMFDMLWERAMPL